MDPPVRLLDTMKREIAMPSEKGRQVLTALSAVVFAFLLAASPARAQWRGNYQLYRWRQLAAMQQYALMNAAGQNALLTGMPLQDPLFVPMQQNVLLNPFQQ